MIVALTWFNVALRGVMEAGIVLALAYWGYRTGQSTWAKILLGIGAPVLVFGFWGLVDFRKAGRMAEALRLVQELVICGLAAVALVVAGQPALGWALGVISVVQHALVYALGERLLKES
jgi:hypothetical protein